MLAGEIGSLLEYALDNVYLGMFDFGAPIESGGEDETWIKSIELSPVQRLTSLSGRSYFNRIGMRGVASLRHQRMHSPNEALKTENIGKGDFVPQLSLQSLQITFDIENTLIEEGGLMHSELLGQVDTKNHFRTDIEFDAEISLPAF